MDHNKIIHTAFLPFIMICIILAVLIPGCKSRSKKLSGRLMVEKNDTVFISGVNDLGMKTFRFSDKVLVFAGDAMLKNGVLDGKNVRIIAPGRKIFENIVCTGDWNIRNAKIQWFTGTDFSDPVRNFEVLCQYANINAEIFLDVLLPVAAKNNRDYFENARILRIKSHKPENAGLILRTKHENLFFSYFRSSSGLNLLFENISIITSDYLSGIRSEKPSEYFLSGSYYQEQFNPTAKPSIDSIIIRNCIIKGNVTLAVYGSHSKNQSLSEFSGRNKISRLLIENSTFDNVNSAFGFANMGYDSLIVKNNSVRNFSETFLNVSESGLNDLYYEPLRKNKKYVEISDNIFENDKAVFTPSGRTLSPCIIKGGYGDMNFVRNTLINIISNNPASDVNTMYYTCLEPGRCVFSHNTVTDVIGRGSRDLPASIIKDRGAENLVIENNKITLSREALVKNGVLRSINEDITHLTGDRFLCTFIQIGNQGGLTKSLIVRNNQVRVPFLNMSTEIYNVAHFEFENNRLEIGSFAPSGQQISVSRDHAFFLGRQRLDRIPTRQLGIFSSMNNTLQIGHIPGGVLEYISFPDGVQSGSAGSPDTNPNYSKALIGDTFIIKNTTVQLSMPDATEHNYSLHIEGEKNSVIVNDGTGANHLRPNAQSYQSHFRLSSSASPPKDESPFVLIANSRQILESEKHDGSDINLLSYTYLTSLFNLANEENLICVYDIQWKDKKGQKNNMSYYFLLNNQERSISLENENGGFITIDPAQYKAIPEPLKAEFFGGTRSSSNPTPKFYYGDRHLSNAQLKLVNCADVQSYRVELNIHKAGRGRARQADARNRVEQLRKNR